jgi:hypothetical protein
VTSGCVEVTVSGGVGTDVDIDGFCDGEVCNIF